MLWTGGFGKIGIVTTLLRKEGFFRIFEFWVGTSVFGKIWEFEVGTFFFWKSSVGTKLMPAGAFPAGLLILNLLRRGEIFTFLIGLRKITLFVNFLTKGDAILCVCVCVRNGNVQKWCFYSMYMNMRRKCAKSDKNWVN